MLIPTARPRPRALHLWPAWRHDLWLSLLASSFVAIGAVFGLAWENPGEVEPSSLLRPLAVLMLLFAAGIGLCALVSRRALPIIPVGLALMFWWGPLKDVVSGGWAGQIAFVVLAGLVAVFAAATWRIERNVLAGAVAMITGTTAAATVLLALPPLLGGPLDNIKLPDPFAQAMDGRRAWLGQGASLPDIFYIVPDRYGSRATLLAEFGWNNDAFYTALESRGFHVAADAHANYPKTFQSLASTLNSQYLDEIVQNIGRISRDQTPMFMLMEDNLVQRHLRELGYRYIHIGNWWDPTYSNRHADENFAESLSQGLRLSRSEFGRTLWEKTPVPRVLGSLGLDIYARHPAKGCRYVKSQIEKLKTIRPQSAPVFVFAHLAVPHDPILIGADGRCLEETVHFSQTTWTGFKKAYVDYLRYFNTAALEIFDAQRGLHDGSAGRGLIFVIQSDEGPFPRRVRETTKEFQILSELDRRELRMKMGTINAMHLAGAGTLSSDQLATPVNNWRIIFEHLLGRDIARLPHRSYVFEGADRLYDFRDVNAELSR